MSMPRCIAGLAAVARPMSRLPEMVEIAVRDADLEGLSPGDMQMLLMELDAATQALAGMGYSADERFDAERQATVFEFRRS